MATVTVKSGDTLSAIAKKAGVNVLDVIAANPQFSNPNLIFPGQQVTIPSKPASQSQKQAAAQLMVSSPLPGTGQTPAQQAGSGAASPQIQQAPQISPSPSIMRQGLLLNKGPQVPQLASGAPATQQEQQLDFRRAQIRSRFGSTFSAPAPAPTTTTSGTTPAPGLQSGLVGILARRPSQEQQLDQRRAQIRERFGRPAAPPPAGGQQPIQQPPPSREAQFLARFAGPGLEGFEAEDALRRSEIRARFGDADFDLASPFGGSALVEILRNRGLQVPAGATASQLSLILQEAASDPSLAPLSSRWVSALERAGLIAPINPFVTPATPFTSGGFSSNRGRGVSGSGGGGRGRAFFPAATIGLINWRIGL